MTVSILLSSVLPTLVRRGPLLALLASTACTDDGLLSEPAELRSASVVMVTQASMGGQTSCAITLSGDLQCWGLGDRGQLGHGDQVTRGDDEDPADAAPVRVGSPAVQVVTNGAQTYARLHDGTVRAWGRNDASQLGLGHALDIGDDETPEATMLPTTVTIGGPATALAVGGTFACALRDDGAVLCWGASDRGQLGLGHTDRVGDDETPADAGAVDLGGPALSLAAGADHACALLDGGSVRCWGANEAGQLGLGHTHDIGDDEPLAAIDPVALGGAAVQVVAGQRHTCARLVDDTVRCWGEGLRGALGYGDTEFIGDDEHPEDVGAVPVGDDVLELTAGMHHTCARLSGGRIRCWGANDRGQLGLGHTHDIGDDESPHSAGDVDLGPHAAITMASGPTADHTCVILGHGGLRCWGANDHGQIGLGLTDDLGDDPTEAPGDLPDIVILMDEDI